MDDLAGSTLGPGTHAGPYPAASNGRSSADPAGMTVNSGDFIMATAGKSAPCSALDLVIIHLPQRDGTTCHPIHLGHIDATQSVAFLYRIVVRSCIKLLSLSYGGWLIL